MAFGVKTNEGARTGSHAPGERPGTRAQVKFVRMSAYKARQVIDTIRGKDTQEAEDILRFTEREAARVIRKCLASAVANAANNDGLDPESLYVSAAYVDEGMTIKRFKPRARGRATRIRKRTCHITVIVSPIPADELERRAKRDAARSTTGGRRTRSASEARAARVARSRAAAGEAPATDEVTDTTEELEATEAEATEADVDDAVVDEPATAATAEDDGVEHPYGPKSAAPLEDGSAPEGYTIKGNADSMLYHPDDSPYFEQTKAEVWFATEEAAEAAGFTAWDAVDADAEEEE
jgi:large subunit ribosomal protein L22